MILSTLRKTLTTAALGLTLLHTTPSLASDHQEQQQIYQAIKAGELIPIRQAIEIAEKAIPGHVIDVDLDIEYAIFAYEIKLLDHAGVKRKIVINAKTSDILSKY